MKRPAKLPTHSVTWLGTDESDEKKGHAGKDFLVGLNGDDTLFGLGGDDVLNGQQGADRLYGGAGQDRLYGSGGDVIWGGLGADTFVFLDGDRLPDITDPGSVRIKDFDAISAQHDILDLSHFAINWASRDTGLEDGFEMLQNRDNVILRLKGADGTITRVVLEDTQLADISESHLFFG